MYKRRACRWGRCGLGHTSEGVRVVGVRTKMSGWRASGRFRLKIAVCEQNRTECAGWRREGGRFERMTVIFMQVATLVERLPSPKWALSPLTRGCSARIGRFFSAAFHVDRIERANGTIDGRQAGVAAGRLMGGGRGRWTTRTADNEDGRRRGVRTMEPKRRRRRGMVIKGAHACFSKKPVNRPANVCAFAANGHGRFVPV